PGGVSTEGLTGQLADLEPYGDDYEFWVGIREAARDPNDMDRWIKEWVLDVPSHPAYVEQLGADRIERLRRRGLAEGGLEELEGALAAVDLSAAASPLELAVVGAARVLQRRIRDRGYRTLLA